jgi:DedD protein
VERLVKERLVGAAVLMAAAIILIPEMLGGPDRARTTPGDESATQTRSQSHGDAPIKTYTIDLSRSPGTQPIVTPEDNRAPPPEEEPAPATQASTIATSPAGTNDEGRPPNPHPATQAEPEPARTPDTNALDRGTVARATAPTTRVVEPPTNPVAPARQAPQSPQPPQPSERPLASGANAPTSGAWAVQLGSFSKQSTAERLVKELQGKGHDAYVMPVKSGSATLYRVRIGPMKDRASAQATLQAVQSIAPGAAVVSQP